ncbi:MAG TPA: hypothetical protein VFQ37_07715 [Mycobacterium sp.]|nr:hypothetical protein [Mycobacterium sp.]
MSDPSARIAQYAESMRGLVSQAGAIVLQANNQFKDGTFDSAQWAKSAYQLVNLAVTAGLEMAPQIMAIPCLPQSSGELELSDFIPIDPDNEYQRVLTVAQPFSQVGAPSCTIPNQFIVFDPPIVRVHAKQFRIGVSWPDLPSGTYRGQVRLTNVQTGAVGVKDVIIDV